MYLFRKKGLSMYFFINKIKYLVVCFILKNQFFSFY